MQHLARCLLCLPGKQIKPAGLINGAALYVWSSSYANFRSHLSVLNAAPYRGSRYFYRTRRRLTRSSLRWERDDWKYSQSLTASEYEQVRRDRDATFAALRTRLLRPETPAKVVVNLLRRHFLASSAFTISDLSYSERAVLIEILHKVLDEWSQWKRATSSNSVPPARIIAFYSRYGILKPQDWAFCLNSLAWTAHEAFSSDLNEDTDQLLQRNFDTFLLLRELLKTWKLFFYCHSRERHDSHEVLNTDYPGLWPLLQHRSLPAALGDYSSNFSLRLLCFAPGWSSDGESFADQQLICASMVSIVALSQSIETSTSISILHPPAVINWEMSRISVPMSSGRKNTISDPAEPPQTALEAEVAPSGLSSDELSMLFIVGQALNSQSINLTLLRVSLSKIVPENRIGQIMTHFSQFRLRVPDLLSLVTFDTQDTADLNPDITAHRVPIPILTKPVRRDPFDTLLQEVHASRTISEVESLTHTYSSLGQRNPRLRSRDFQVAVYKRYWELGSPDQEREVWKASPMIHTDKELWASRLEFYFRRNDITGFEDVWAGLIAAKHAVSAADWCKKLQLYFNCSRLGAVLEHFDVLLKVSGRSQHNDPSVIRPPDPGNIITVETFNLMIKNLLENDELSFAVAIKQRLDWQQDIKANDKTYDLFFSYLIDCGRPRVARRWLKGFTDASSYSNFIPHFKLIRHGLQRWPRTAPWANIHLVMEVFDRVLGDKYHKSRVLRRISLVPDTNGTFSAIKVSPIPGSDTLNLDFKKGVADKLTEKIPMRLDIPLSLAAEALRTDFVSLMSALAEEYANPVKARMMLILWTYCALQGIPHFQEIEECLNSTLSRLPFRQQLRLLCGDIYKRLAHVKYRNFAYIRTHFGPDFAVRRLEGLGLDRYAPLIRKLPWCGFTSYNDQLLLEVGVTSARARSLFLDDISALHHDLKTIRKEEQSQCQSRMVTKEGIWYLSDSSVDNSGSLRRIPFERWEPEAKRQATERFKVATAAPKLLGGEGALHRFKQRLLFKGRKALTKGRKSLIVRPLRKQLLRRRRGRQIKMIYKWRNVVRRRIRDAARLRDGHGSSQESILKVQSTADVRRHNSKRDVIRDLPTEDKTIIVPAINSRPLINLDAQKTTKKDQPRAQQVPSSSDIKSDEKSETIRVRRLTSKRRRVIRFHAYGSK
jgi:hypothetical protein